MQGKTVSALVFAIGLLGFAALIYGIAYWSLPLALVVGGAVAMWWSWYVSIGAQLQLSKQGKQRPQGDS